MPSPNKLSLIISFSNELDHYVIIDIHKAPNVSQVGAIPGENVIFIVRPKLCVGLIEIFILHIKTLWLD